MAQRRRSRSPSTPLGWPWFSWHWTLCNKHRLPLGCSSQYSSKANLENIIMYFCFQTGDGFGIIGV